MRQSQKDILAAFNRLYDNPKFSAKYTFNDNGEPVCYITTELKLNAYRLTVDSLQSLKRGLSSIQAELRRHDKKHKKKILKEEKQNKKARKRAKGTL